MSNNSNLDLNGLNPLSYLGVNPKTPVPFFSRSADPTPEDYDNFILGTIWLNTANENIWMLVSKANRIAVWVQLSSGSSGTMTSLTGNSGGLVLPLGGNINVVGDGTTIDIVGNPVTHTLTASLIGGSATISITGDTGGPLVSNSFTFTGGTTGLSFGGAGTTQTLTFAGITANGGTVSLATDATASVVNLGTGAGAKTVTIGSTNTTSTTNLQSGSGGIKIPAFAEGALVTSSTGIISTVTGAAGDVLTANAPGVAPSFQPSSAGSISITGDTGGALIGSAFTFTGGTTGLSFDGLGTTETLIFAGINANGGIVNLGTDVASYAINIGTVASSGRAITIGNDTGTTSMSLIVGTAGFDLTGVGSSNYTIGSITTTGIITIGGNAQSGTIALGSSSATNIVGIGIGTGATTVNIATGATNAKTVNIGTGAAANTVTIGSTNTTSTTNLQSGSGGINIPAFAEGALVTSSTGLISTVTGTAGFVLTANAAGTAPSFQAASGGGLLTTTVLLTSSQIKNLHATPIQLLAAPGAGFYISPLRVVSTFTYGGSNPFIAGAAQTIGAYFGTALAIGNMLENGPITGTVSYLTDIGGLLGGNLSIFENIALNAYQPQATEISGNAADNNTLKVNVWYNIVAV